MFHLHRCEAEEVWQGNRSGNREFSCASLRHPGGKKSRIINGTSYYPPHPGPGFGSLELLTTTTTTITDNNVNDNDVNGNDVNGNDVNNNNVSDNERQRSRQNGIRLLPFQLMIASVENSGKEKIKLFFISWTSYRKWKLFEQMREAGESETILEINSRKKWRKKAVGMLWPNEIT